MKVIFRLAHFCLENWWNISIQRKAEGTFFLSFCLMEGTVIQYSIWCWAHAQAYTNKGYIVSDNKKQQGNLISFKLKKIGLSSQHNLYCKLCLFSALRVCFCVCVWLWWDRVLHCCPAVFNLRVICLHYPVYDRRWGRCHLYIWFKLFSSCKTLVAASLVCLHLICLLSLFFLYYLPYFLPCLAHTARNTSGYPVSGRYTQIYIAERIIKRNHNK